jgi:hypothetical protein
VESSWRGAAEANSPYLIVVRRFYGWRTANLTRGALDDSGEALSVSSEKVEIDSIHSHDQRNVRNIPRCGNWVSHLDLSAGCDSNNRLGDIFV